MVSRRKIFQPHALGLVNLRYSRIMHDDLHHAITQRGDLSADNLQPAVVSIGMFARFNFSGVHFKTSNDDSMRRYYEQFACRVNHFFEIFLNAFPAGKSGGNFLV